MSWAITAVGIGTVSAGVSIYGSQTSASAQRQAASQNAYLSRLQASSTAAVTRYQAQLNYNTAMAQSAIAAQNATILHNSARILEKNGNEQLGRLVKQQQAQNSEVTAAYASGGVNSDSGSAQVVQGYNAGMQQLKRLDGLYSINSAAFDKDWQGTMQQYQSDLTAATAQQFKYAEQMANWSEKMGISSANLQQQIANDNANATQLQGYSTAVNSLASGFNSYADISYKSTLTPRSSRLGLGGEGGL
jgi:hypothetical protein